jgi:methylenetetrahydrofolate dehydrogenase (NADP+)/methenyltetrahydrofolate cyclohydrolase
MVTLIDGKTTAETIKAELTAEISSFTERKPGLAVIIVGDDPASHYYVNSKQKACTTVGINSFKSELAHDITKAELIEVIQSYNNDDKVDGILLQLPLPASLSADTQEIIDAISATKDVDGLTTTNLGKLLSKSKDAIEPCTPKGCMELLKRYQIEIQGKKAIVIGRSTLVGKPIALLLNNANATVVMAHSKTKNLDKEIKNADIVIAAIGKAEFIKGSLIKEGAVVIDVGINAIEVDGKRKLVGDIEFAEAQNQAEFITPVPGGVGPMTVAMLLKNTLELYQKRKSLAAR